MANSEFIRIGKTCVVRRDNIVAAWKDEKDGKTYLEFILAVSGPFSVETSGKNAKRFFHHFSNTPLPRASLADHPVASEAARQSVAETA